MISPYICTILQTSSWCHFYWSSATPLKEKKLIIITRIIIKNNKIIQNVKKKEFLSRILLIIRYYKNSSLTIRGLNISVTIYDK